MLRRFLLLRPSRPPPAGERSQGEGGLGYPEQGGAPAPHSVNPWFLRTSFT